MILNDEQLKNLCEIAKTAALAAGKIIINAQESGDFKVMQKEGGENLASQVVTEIDHQAQEVILKILKPTLSNYDLALLTEESPDDGSRFEKDYFWCIDPLDGTLAFSRDEDGYSTSIALVRKDGTPLIGVVFNPRSKSLYYAIKGYGAFVNNKSLKVNKNEHLTLLFDQSFLKIENYQDEINKLERITKELGLRGLKQHHLGGAVMNGISTIELAPAIYCKHPKKSLGGGSIWDFAASSVIQSEAGGYNRNYYLNELDLNRKDNTFMNHEGIIFASSEHLAKNLITLN